MPFSKVRTTLTPQMQRFVDEYLVDLNASNAAIAAGYSKATANRRGYELLQVPVVQAAINKAKRERAERTQITSDLVLQNILRVRNLAEKAGKYGDALRGDELLGKHLKLFTERVELEAGESLAARLEKAIARAKR